MKAALKVDGPGPRRHAEHRRRDVGRAADRLPDLGQQRLRNLAEGGDGDRGRLRARASSQDHRQADHGLQRVQRSRRSARTGRPSSAAATSSSCSRTRRRRARSSTYLATPAAATIWAKRGGFSSPNKNVPASAYTDPLNRATAIALAHAKTFRFDLSDLQPAAFGGTVGQGEFKIFQDFLKNPSNVERHRRRSSEVGGGCVQEE